MKILVRLPNWLGDMVMSTGFLRAVQSEWPDSVVDVIVKKGLDPLLDFIPGINKRYVFSKSEYKGLRGANRFGKKIRKEEHYDLFFCLPNSFSSAIMGKATGAERRIGFKKEGRSFLLTDSWKPPGNLHRAEEYACLLEKFTGKEISPINVKLTNPVARIPGRLILNFNSEAVSRRMPVMKGASILRFLVESMPGKEFCCLGSEKDKDHVASIIHTSGTGSKVQNMAGTTPTLIELVSLIGTASAMLTTDSGPAHVANALGVPVLVLFGAGNEKNTAPYNKEGLRTIRLGQLNCEPCVKNTCIYGSPKCLELLDEKTIASALQEIMK